jgi:hypothetical protein
MSFYEPNPDVRPSGEEPAEYIDDPTLDPPPPASPDPTGEARGDGADDDSPG